MFLRTYCRKIDKKSVVAGDEAHHLIKVLRCRLGDQVDLFDGNGATASGSIVRIGKDTVEISASSIQIHEPSDGGRVIICASLAKGERYDRLIEKCTELGVDRICPVIFERTVKLASGHSVERYRKIALSAAKQCERLFLPQIDAPKKFADCLAELSREYPKGRMLFGSMSEKAGTVFEKTQDIADYMAFIGPEGGLTAEEEKMLADSGALGVGLTKTILRIETAAIAFASILCIRSQRG